MFIGLKILKKILLCFFIIAVQDFLFVVFSQSSSDIKEIYYENVTVSDILDSLSREFRVNFSYNAGLDFFHEKHSLQKKGNLEQQLQCLFKNQNLEFSIEDKQVVVYSLLTPQSGKALKEERADFKLVKGKVISAVSGEILSFSSVFIRGTNIASIANNDGEFSLKIPKEYIQDSLVVTFIGYYSKAIFIPSVPDTNFVVKLEESVTHIGAVHVKLISGEEIVDACISRIKGNYSNGNVMYTAFYREAIDDENTCLSLSEALLDIAKAPYRSVFLNDQARVFRGRKEENQKIKKLDFKLEGGVYNSLRLDVVKEEAAFLTSDGSKNYEYKYRKVIQYDGRSLHVIDFKPKQDAEDIVFEGTLYIDVENKALVAAIFQMSNEGLKYARNQLVKKQPRKANIKPVSAEYMVYYRYINGKYYLHYTRAALTVKAKSDRLFLNNKFHAVAELAVTDIDTTNTSRFKWADVVKSSDILNERLSHYDDSFWGSYNIISPGLQIKKAQEKFDQLRDQE